MVAAPAGRATVLGSASTTRAAPARLLRGHGGGRRPARHLELGPRERDRHGARHGRQRALGHGAPSWRATERAASSPGDGAVYPLGEAVNADYECRDEAAAPASSCRGRPARRHGPWHTVTATDEQATRLPTTVGYRWVGPHATTSTASCGRWTPFPASTAGRPGSPSGALRARRLSGPGRDRRRLAAGGRGRVRSRGAPDSGAPARSVWNRGFATASAGPLPASCGGPSALGRQLPPVPAEAGRRHAPARRLPLRAVPTGGTLPRLLTRGIPHHAAKSITLIVMRHWLVLAAVYAVVAALVLPGSLLASEDGAAPAARPRRPATRSPARMGPARMPPRRAPATIARHRGRARRAAAAPEPAPAPAGRPGRARCRARARATGARRGRARRDRPRRAGRRGGGREGLHQGQGQDKPKAPRQPRPPT